MKHKRFVCKPDGEGYSELHAYLVANESKVMTYYATEGLPKKRSSDSNALQAVWIAEVSEHTGEPKTYVRDYVKAELGLPILRYDAETPEEQQTAKMINFTLDKIGFDDFTPKQQIGAMKLFNVTSAMSRRQHKKMLDDMVCYYANKLGLVLVSNRGKR